MKTYREFLVEAGFMKIIGKFVKHYIKQKLAVPKPAKKVKAPKQSMTPPPIPASNKIKKPTVVLDRAENIENLKQWNKLYGPVDPNTGMNAHQKARSRLNQNPEKYDKMKHSKAQKELYDGKPPKYERRKVKLKRPEMEDKGPPLIPDNTVRFDFK